MNSFLAFRKQHEKWSQPSQKVVELNDLRKIDWSNSPHNEEHSDSCWTGYKDVFTAKCYLCHLSS
jgi:hypothetical protein